jgi:DNA relaxase NicK
MPGYNGGMGATHARLFWHSENRRQNIGVVMTGEDMRSVLAVPMPHEALLRWCVAKSKKISRLDFALDIFDSAANPHDILDAWKTGKATTPAQKVMDFTSYAKDTDGNAVAAPTVYVGARQSDRQLRIYDKAKQMGVDRPWVRVELQVRDDRAWHLAMAMVRYGISRAGQQALRDYVAIPELRWWVDAVSG